MPGGEDGRDAGTGAHIEGAGRRSVGRMDRRRLGDGPGEESAGTEDDRIVHVRQHDQGDPVHPPQARAFELPQEEGSFQPQPEQSQEADQLAPRRGV